MTAKSGLANVHAVYAVYRRFKARRQQGARLPMIEERDNTDERASHLKHSIKGDQSVTQRQEVTDPHAELRAMLEALPSLDISVHDGVTATVGSWLLRAPALVRALLEERGKLVEQLAARPRADVYVTAASHNDAMRALERERDALKVEVEKLRAAKPADAAALKEKLNEIIAKDRIELAKAESAADAAWRERLLAFEEHRMRCMMAATLLGGMYADTNVHPGNPKHPGMVHDAVDALIAEARRRKEAKP